MPQLTFAFWNVANLFEPLAVPRGPQSEAELVAKLAALAGVLAAIDNGNGPHLLGLAEVGTERIFDMLHAALPSEYIAVWEPAPRIDLTGLGLAARSDHFASIQIVDVERPSMFARPRVLLTRCELIGQPEPVFVAVCHWKSRMQQGGTDPTQEQLASARWLAERLGPMDRGTCVVVLGDFNAEPFEPPFNDAGLRCRRHFSSILAGTATPAHLYNTAWQALPEPDAWEDLTAAGMKVTRPRTSHDASPPVIFDQLLVSRAALRLGPIRLLEQTVRYHVVDGVNSVRRSSGNLAPLRWTFDPGGAHSGCADHYPLLAEFMVG
jgi:hypothetical protein